jgi:asparagine synthase (glutamine-hydrolysing)
LCSDVVSVNHVSSEGFEGALFLNSKLPSKASDLYFTDSKNDIIVLAKTNIYNRKDLLSYCNLDSGIPEPQLIASLFALDGPAFAEKLNGDFAIFICRPLRREMFLFRDHIGIAPIAYTIEKDALHFSTDIIALSKAFSQNEPFDNEYLLGYFKYIDYRRTPVVRVKKLLPGCYLHFSEKGLKITRYWKPEKIKINRQLHYEKVVSDLDALVRDAVRIRCDARFNAGGHVSGGLDSGIVSALAKKEYHQQDSFYGFSWSPLKFICDESAYDERKMVTETCESLGITPVYNDTTPDEYLEYVCNYFYNQGYFLEEKVTDQAVKRGVNLLFSGWGGDEFISTGDRGIEIDLLTGLHLRTFFHRNPLKHPRLFAKWLFFYVINPVFGLLNKATRSSFSNDAHYLKKRFRHSDRKAIKRFYFHLSRHQMHLRLLNFYNLQERCESWTMNGFRKGIEYRYPLLDKRIVEYMLRVPSTVLCEKDGFRPLLRDIGKGILPENVRQNEHKIEPVTWSNVDEIEKSVAIKLMDEAEEWQKNSDLSFVEFGLLLDDIHNYRNQSSATDNKVIFRALIYLKALNEFTVKFRSQGFEFRVSGFDF